jgi:hypothetical protein
MPRWRGRRPCRVPDLLTLMIGPSSVDGFTEAELEFGWERHGRELLEGNTRPGARPWGWWRFVAGEDQPRDRWNSEIGQVEDYGLETIRLAELGELSDDELAAIRERANEGRARIGSDDERISGGWRNTSGAVSLDVQAVELCNAVQAAVERGRS